MSRKAHNTKEGLLYRIIDLLQAGLTNGSFAGGSTSVGIGVPSNSFGTDGDVYIDSNTGIMYIKMSGVWVNQGVRMDVNYEYVQGIPVSVWNVVHNLNKYPTVTILDASGNEIEACTEHINKNNTTISFFSASAPVAVAGTAIFN